MNATEPPPHEPARRPTSLSALRGSLRNAAGIVFIVQVAGAGFSYVLHVVLARSMATTGYGVFAYVLGWATVLGTLATIGIPGTALRFVRLLLRRDDVPGVHALWHWGAERLASAGMFVAVAGATAAVAIAWNGQATTAALVGLASVMVVAFACTEWSVAVARSLERPLLAYLPQLVLRPSVALAAIILLAAAGPVSATASLGVFAAAAVLMAAVQFGAVRARVLRLRKPAKTASSETIEPQPLLPAPGPTEWRAASISLWTFSAVALGLNRSNLLLLGALRSADEVAVYNAAAKTAWLAAFVLMAVNAVIGPYFGGLFDRGDRLDLQQLLRKAMRWIALPSVLIVLFLVVASPVILGMFGPAYRIAAPVLVILALGALVNALSGPAGLILNTTGHESDSTRVYSWSLVCNLLIAIPLILLLGALGAAIADVLTLTLWNLWLASLVRRKIGVDPTVFQLFVPR